MSVDLFVLKDGHYQLENSKPAYFEIQETEAEHLRRLELSKEGSKENA